MPKVTLTELERAATLARERTYRLRRAPLASIFGAYVALICAMYVSAIAACIILIGALTLFGLYKLGTRSPNFQRMDITITIGQNLFWGGSGRYTPKNNTTLMIYTPICNGTVEDYHPCPEEASSTNFIPTVKESAKKLGTLFAQHQSPEITIVIWRTAQEMQKANIEIQYMNQIARLTCNANTEILHVLSAIATTLNMPNNDALHLLKKAAINLGRLDKALGGVEDPPKLRHNLNALLTTYADCAPTTIPVPAPPASVFLPAAAAANSTSTQPLAAPTDEHRSSPINTLT